MMYLDAGYRKGTFFLLDLDERSDVLSEVCCTPNEKHFYRRCSSVGLAVFVGILRNSDGTSSWEALV